MAAEILARPGEPLVEHLQNVATRAADTSMTGSLDGIGLSTLAHDAALLHDAAKATQAFQEYVTSDDDEASPHGHAAPSALITFTALNQDDEYSTRAALVAMYAVAKHHQGLAQSKDPNTYIHDNIVADYDRFIGILKAIEACDGGDEALSTVFDDLHADADWASVKRELREETPRDELRNATRPNGVPSDSQYSTEFYTALLHTWGALHMADVSTASGVENDHFTATRPTAARVENYVQSLRSGETTQLDDERERARQAVAKNAKEFASDDADVATITLPTGLGKTITGTHAALTILDEDERVDGSEYVSTDEGRLVYALPYTSIIDQTAAKYTNEFFPKSDDATGDLVTIHHHLSDTRTEPDCEDEAETPATDEIATLLGESWLSGTVITTFVQLFESLVAPSKTQSVKLPQLANSVIILDEPQSLPIAWWPLVRELAYILTNAYDATIISMTATQPYIFEQDDRLSTTELVDNPEHYFTLDAVDRVRYTFEQSVFSGSTCTHADAADTIVSETAGAAQALAVCNTIESANTLYEELANIYERTCSLNTKLDEYYQSAPSKSFAEFIEQSTPADTQQLALLTSRHRPKDRERIISYLKQSSAPVTLVSTQLIEAGVDISFERVYRDFAPLDSIVQAAGRCNRENEGDIGTVHVWRLESPTEGGLSPSTAIYAGGSNLLNITRTALEETGVDGATGERLSVDQEDIAYDAVNAYYEHLSSRNPGNQTYQEALKDCDLPTLRDLSLITQAPETVDVIVCRTEVESELLDTLIHQCAENKYAAAFDTLDELATARVSLPLYGSDASEAVGTLPSIDSSEKLSVRYIDYHNDGREQLFFDDVEGLRVPDTTAEARIL